MELGATSFDNRPSATDVEQAKKDGHSILLWSPSPELTLPSHGEVDFTINFVRLRSDVPGACVAVTAFTSVSTQDSAPRVVMISHREDYHDAEQIAKSEKGEIKCRLDLGQSGAYTRGVYVSERPPWRDNDDAEQIANSEEGDIKCRLHLGENTYSGEGTMSVHVIDRRPTHDNEAERNTISNALVIPVRFE